MDPKILPHVKSESGSNGLLLTEVEQISKALNLHKVRRNAPKVRTSLIDLFQKEKTSSFTSNLIPSLSDNSGSEDSENETDDIKFTVIDQGIEVESVFHDITISRKAELDSLSEKGKLLEQVKCMNPTLIQDEGKMVKLFSFVDMESVENDFLKLLCTDQNFDLSSGSEPESPREQHLLRQIEEEEVQASDELVFDFDATGEQVEFTNVSPVTCKGGDCSDHFDFSLAFQAVKKENDRVSRLLGSRGEAKMLKNVETEDLMQELGLNAKAFQDCPQISPGGFGSPVYISPEKPPELPPLREGSSPVVRA